MRTERQTHDCVSLRFRIARAGALPARPGQFLTFDWLLDGRKLARCYSISSSPTQTGFVEITVKKQLQGCVSAFLNERVSMGLTVEAKGPSGRFCFDEKDHKSIVLFAAGSGITPIISILRYIDDLCPDTKATLFYSVRTQQDIIFAAELERLQQRLPNFQQVIVVTKPESGESFGGARVNAQAETPGGIIEFTKSGGAGGFPDGQTLLEAAERKLRAGMRRAGPGKCQSGCVSL